MRWLRITSCSDLQFRHVFLAHSLASQSTSISQCNTEVTMSHFKANFKHWPPSPEQTHFSPHFLHAFFLPLSPSPINGNEIIAFFLTLPQIKITSIEQLKPILW